jgi:hypothetical protein
MGATKIMVIRHAEKPDSYGSTGTAFYGVDPTGSLAGNPDGDKHLITQGWQRVGALVTLFAPLRGTVAPPLAKPQFLFASDPGKMHEKGGHGPSKRPAETLSGVAASLGLTPNTSFADTAYDDMIEAALACQGAVLIAWQHEDIPLLSKTGSPGISQSILDHTDTPAATSSGWHIPKKWPKGPLWQGGQPEARYDLVLVFDRPTGTGPITDFALYGQMLIAGDQTV